MKRNKIIILIGSLFVFAAHADTVDYIDMQLDAQVAELTSRRDKLKADLDACEKNTRGYKIAGIATLGATGVGVVGNIKLAQEIEKQKILKDRGGGGYSSGGSGTVGVDTRTTEQKAQGDCEMYCTDFPDEAGEIGCEC